MKIYFCDDCNESIPLQDIKDGRAVTLKGKIFCKNCNPLKEVEAVKAPSRSSKWTNVLLGLVAVLLLTVIGLMIFYKGGAQEDWAITRNKVNQALSQIDHLQSEFESRLQDRAAPIEQTQGNLVQNQEKLETGLMELRGDLLGLRSENENIARNLQAVTNVRERLDQLILKQDELAANLEEQGTSLEHFKEMLKGQDARIEKVAQSVKAGAFIPGGQTGEDWQNADQASSARIDALKAKLASKDAGERFEAVYAVLDERIKEALPLVMPLIEDPDQFVQVGAIQTVGEFLYLDAIPALVKVLRDPDATVRDEALRQLIRMTGQNDLTFDVRASDSEREKAVKKWEKWLKERK